MTNKIVGYLKCTAWLFGACIHYKRILPIKLINLSTSSHTFFECVTAFTFDFFSKFQLWWYDVINYSPHVLHWIFRPYLSYNWKFLPFRCPLPIPSSPALGSHFFTPYCVSSYFPFLFHIWHHASILCLAHCT